MNSPWYLHESHETVCIEQYFLGCQNLIFNARLKQTLSHSSMRLILQKNLSPKQGNYQEYKYFSALSTQPPKKKSETFSMKSLKWSKSHNNIL